MHASTTPTVRRVAATSALALVALSGAAGTAVAAPGNQGHHGKGKSNGPSSSNAAPQADRPQGKAKAKGHDKGPKPSAGQGSQGSPGPSGSGSAGTGGGAAGGAGSGDAAGGGPAKGSPPGNNGTVKIAPLGEMDGIPNNSPHPGCDFQVEWYGFDEGADVVSRVSFAMQAPTGDVGLTVNGPSEVFVGEDPASGAGQDPDGVQAYTLSFDGAPHPQQGYHVKLTVNTPRSNGSDVKHKVFWVEDCEDSGPSSLAPPDGEESGSLEGPAGGSESSEVSGSESGSVSGSGSDSAEGADSTDSAEGAGSTGTASRSGVSQDVTTSGETDTPTSVDAGATGSDIARGSLIGLLVAAVGGALLWYARRTRAHG